MGLRIGIAGAIGALVLAGTARAHDVPADVVFINGRVITVDAHDTIATGVAVLGNRIVAVGDVADWQGPTT